VAARQPIDDERNALVLLELQHIRGTVARLESVIAMLSANLDAVRVADLSGIRNNIATEVARLTAQLAAGDAEIKLLRYQIGRTTAIWSLISGGVASAIVAAVMALVMHR
jgi:hypothetical protein